MIDSGGYDSYDGKDSDDCAETGGAERVEPGLSEIGENESPYFTEIKNEAFAAFGTAKETYLEEYGSHMPESSKVRLESVTPEKNMKVYTELEYNCRYPGANRGEIGRATDNNTIEMKGLSEEQVRHTTFHELGHVSSFYSKNVEMLDDDSGKTVEHIQTGVKTKTFVYSADGERLGSETVIENAALNEGITEYFARDAMEKSGLDGTLIPTGYQDALDLVTQLNELVGNETLRNSYFGGDCSLKDVVNVLGESPDTFGNLSRNLDLVTYSPDDGVRAQAKLAVNTCIVQMAVNAAGAGGPRDCGD